jgi:hypothetical protein
MSCTGDSKSGLDHVPDAILQGRGAPVLVLLAVPPVVQLRLKHLDLLQPCVAQIDGASELAINLSVRGAPNVRVLELAVDKLQSRRGL